MIKKKISFNKDKKNIELGQDRITKQCIQIHHCILLINFIYESQLSDLPLHKKHIH